MASNTQWTTCGRKLLLNGKSFFIRGVNYAPTPIGLPGRLDMLGHEEIFMRDLVNLRDMHANAVKTYDFNPEIDHSKYLDAAYNGGEKPIYSIFSIWIDQTLMEPVVDIDSPEFQAVVQGYYDMAKTTGNHPGVMGYSIGGEMNSIVVVNDKAFWEKFALLTQAVRRGLKENSGAQKIITTTFVDDGGMSFTAGERYKADVDMWGSNVYQTNYPGSVIPTYMRVPGGKPMLVSEYGYPYASNIAEGTEEELHTVGKLLIKQTVAMEANFKLTDSLKEQVLVGGFVFEYSDEWWKSGAENVHNLGGVMNRNFPMGWLSEEFFGLYRAVKSEEDNEHALDEMQARPTVDLIKAVWSKGSIAGEGDDYSSCAVSLGSTANLQLRHPLESPSPTGAVGSFIEGMFAVVALCALALLAFAVYDTKMRRSRYRRLSPVLKPEEGSQSAHTRPSLHQSVAASRRYSQVVDGDENEAVV